MMDHNERRKANIEALPEGKAKEDALAMQAEWEMVSADPFVRTLLDSFLATDDEEEEDGYCTNHEPIVLPLMTLDDLLKGE